MYKHTAVNVYLYNACMCACIDMYTVKTFVKNIVERQKKTVILLRQIIKNDSLQWERRKESLRSRFIK